MAEAQGVNTDRGPPAGLGGSGSGGGIYDPELGEGDDIEGRPENQECGGNFFEKKACEIKNAGQELVGDVVGAAKKVASCFDGWGATCTKWAGVLAGGLAVAGLCVVTVGAGCVAAGFVAAGALQGALWCKGGSLGGCAAKGALVAGVAYLAGGIVAKVAAPVLRPLLAPFATRVAPLASRLVPAVASRALSAAGAVAERSRARMGAWLGKVFRRRPTPVPRPAIGAARLAWVMRAPRTLQNANVTQLQRFASWRSAGLQRSFRRPRRVASRCPPALSRTVRASGKGPSLPTSYSSLRRLPSASACRRSRRASRVPRWWATSRAYMEVHARFGRPSRSREAGRAAGDQRRGGKDQRRHRIRTGQETGRDHHRQRRQLHR